MRHWFLYELRLQLSRPSDVIQLLFFYIVAATLLVFAAGDQVTLSDGQGIFRLGHIWLLLVFSLQLAQSQFFQSDYQDGSLLQLCLQPVSLPLLLIAKYVAWWLVWVLPLLAVTPVLLYGFARYQGEIQPLLMGLCLGSLGLLAIQMMVAALAVSSRRASALGVVLCLPLMIPLLIMGGEIGTSQHANALWFLIAWDLLMLPLSIVVSAFAIRTVYK